MKPVLRFLQRCRKFEARRQRGAISYVVVRYESNACEVYYDDKRAVVLLE